MNRYTTTKQHVEKCCRHSIGLCPRGNSFQQAQEKVEKRGTFKASGITPYEPSELYNALDTIVALQESIADASFFQEEICFIFSRIFVYKGTFILEIQICNAASYLWVFGWQCEEVNVISWSDAKVSKRKSLFSSIRVFFFELVIFFTGSSVI